MNQSLSNIIDLTNAPTPPRWFEFLLEPGRLQQHLNTDGCDPSPIELITLFFRNIPTLDTNNTLSPKNATNFVATNGVIPSNSSSSPSGGSSPVANDESSTNNKSTNDLGDKLLIDYSDSADVTIPPDSYEAKYRLKKAYALQTLAIKVASFLKWDLDIICNNLSIPTQYKLMQAFTNACSSQKCPPEVKKFASVIYCHWFLKSAITYQLSTLQPQSNNTTIIYLSQLQQQQQAADSSALSSMGELFAPSSKPLKTCSSELHSYIWELTHNKENSAKRQKSLGHPFKKAKLTRPLIDCFDSRDEQFNDWGKCEVIEPLSFIDAACYDLGRFFFFEESYALARKSFEIIKDSSDRFPMLNQYLNSVIHLLNDSDQNGSTHDDSEKAKICDKTTSDNSARRLRTEQYLIDCMNQSRMGKKDVKMEVEEGEIDGDDEDYEEDSDLRFEQQNQHNRFNENHIWYLQTPQPQQQQQLLEATKGDVFMSQGNYKDAMGCFVGTIMLMTDYFRFFSKNYVDEEPYISRMIQCSISLSCYTQAVALCQMTRNLNYTIAFKQLNERICNDCCDDIYECIWNVTLLEYIINLHSKRGEVERRTRVMQLIGQLELNENNPEDILKEAEHVRRGRFFRIMSNKYL